MGYSSALAHLVACAQAIEDRNPKLADSLLEVIWNLADEESDERQRLVKYFAEALVRRAYGLHPVSIYFSLQLPPLSYDYDFISNVVIDAIMNTVMGKKRLHLIDFYIPHLYGSSRYLFQRLPARSSNPLSVRVSVIVPPFLKHALNVQKEEQYLTEKAELYEVKLEEEFLKVVYANSLGEVDDASMSSFRRTQEDEAVVVFYFYKLRTLLAEAGAMERELVKLRQINPEIVIIEEQDANLSNDSNFIKRLEDCFQYYSLACGFHSGFFSEYCRRLIGNIVGCEGRDRIVRPQTLAQWRSRLLSAGFLQVPVRLKSLPFISYAGTPFIPEENGYVFLGKENHPSYFVSAWKVRQWEDHFNRQWGELFNPNSNSFVPGFNPILPSPNILQPLPVFPEGFFLKRLTAVTEIYDMLEEVCYKHKLLLALTWTSWTNVNELIMSDPYTKPNLFFQTRSCYLNYVILKEKGMYYEEFIKMCANRYQLVEGEDIAGKALQSNEQFHFEPCLDATESDYPIASIAFEYFGSHVAIAICLQNHYITNDVYVVEFLLPTFNTELEESKSLAFGIFNDLKNMKKRFVTLRSQATEVGFQEEATSKIPQVTMPMTNLPQVSLTTDLNTVETRDGHVVETVQGLNEQQWGVIPNFHACSLPDAVTSPFNPPNPMSYNGVLETQVPHKQGNGKRISCKPNANNENEKVKAEAKKRKRTSDVWEEFTKKEDDDGKEWAVCAHCNRKFDGSSLKGTTHLRNHLKRCKIRAAKVRDQPGTGDSKNETFEEGESSFDQDRSSMDVARMIIKLQYPLNVVQDEFFNILFKNLQPMFKLQSQEALSSDIVRVYKEEKGRLLEYFPKLSCRFNLTMSLWAHDIEKITYCCYSVQFIDENWELKKKILALKIFGHEFDTRIFYESFKSLLVDWNFDKKVCSLTIDNSSSSLEIDEEIRKSWSSFEDSHPLSTFYISSDKDFNMLQNVGSSIDGVIGTSKPYLVDIHDFYKKQSQQERRGYPLMNVKSDNSWRTCSMILAIATILDPRSKFNLVKFLYRSIYDYEASRIHLTIIRNALTDIFNEYASNMYNGKSLFVETNSLTLLNAGENTMESFHKWYDSKRNNVTSEALWKSELDKYIQEPIISCSVEFDVLCWWSEHASSFPILGRMACDFLAIPISSIISGSSFDEKVVENPIFKGLNPEIIEAMICGKDWLESPKEISHMEPNNRSENIGRPDVELKDSPSLAHYLELERVSSEPDNEASWNEDHLGREATTWAEKDVRAYLVSPLTEKELKELNYWKNHDIIGESVGRYKISGKALEPLLLIPPRDGDLGIAQKYYIEDTVVNQFFDLLKRRSEKFPHKYVKHYSFESYIAAFLIAGSKTESEVLSWIKQDDLKGVSKLFLPICLREHWLLFYVDIDDNKLLWLDSNEHSRMSNVSEKLVILRWFQNFLLPLMGHDHKHWLFDVPTNIPLQKNSVDCAIFVMKYADCLTHCNIKSHHLTHVLFTQDDMSHFRRRTFVDLCDGNIQLG
ncbi:hypothetical protein REPUB_Repub20aG0026200 [Reevesia pubescens]